MSSYVNNIDSKDSDLDVILVARLLVMAHLRVIKACMLLCTKVTLNNRLHRFLPRKTQYYTMSFDKILMRRCINTCKVGVVGVMEF